ncbi:MAG TPA: ABC transporter permease [Actinomycetota bacterium]|jgi:spermidine/putrescine transport system permease protein|nr:ABC transporter permease [Actinomycetota bacterium]
MSVVTAEREQRVLEPAPLHRPNKRWTRFLLPGFTGLMIAYLMSPVFVMILYGFNNIPGERQTPKFWGFTIHWYKELFAIQGLTTAIKNSLIIAPTAAVVATIIGTFLGLALGRYLFRGKGAVDFFIFLAIAVPEIVLGSSLLSMFVQARASLGLGTILLSHIAFDVPFVAVTVQARVAGMDRSLEDAAQDLFADPVTTFFKVTLPQILPGIFAGFLLAFVLSLDDFVITQFVSGQTETFPIWVWGSTRIGLPPQVNVMATLLFTAGVVISIANVAAQRLRRSRAA